MSFRKAPILFLVRSTLACAILYTAGAPSQGLASTQNSSTQAVAEALLQQSFVIGFQPNMAQKTQMVETGNIVWNWAGSQVPGTFSVVWTSANGLKVTSTTAIGTRTEQVNWATATMTDERQRSVIFGSHTAARSILKYAPSLELATILALPSRELASMGTTTLNGVTVDVVTVAGPWPTNSTAQADRTVILYLDHTSHLILQRSDLIETGPTLPGHLLRSIQYSDYRKVDGISVPFSVAETLNGQATYTVTFTSVTTQ